MEHQTVLHPCMDCPLHDILPASNVCRGAGTPGAEASGSQQASVKSTNVAVRHALGISILTVSIPTQVSEHPPHATVDVSPKYFVPASMQIAATLWNPLIAGELLYACGDLSLHSLQLPPQGSKFSPGVQRGIVSEEGIPQPRCVVSSLSASHMMIPKDTIALAILSHPRRVYLATGSTVYYTDVRPSKSCFKLPAMR